MSTTKTSPWFQLACGTRCYPQDPVRTIPNWEAVHKLIPRVASKICRFGCQTEPGYSLAQHCVGVAGWVAAHGGTVSQQLQALLHDGGECFLGGDIPRPVRMIISGYDELETGFIKRILEVYRLPSEIDDIVWAGDDELLAIEAEFFLEGGPLEDWTYRYLPPERNRDEVARWAWGCNRSDCFAWSAFAAASVFKDHLDRLSQAHFALLNLPQYHPQH